MLYYRSADMINCTAQYCADGLAGMKRTAESAKLPVLREASTFELGCGYLLLGNYEEAVNVWKAGIAAFPNNAEMHNAAYVLAENLKRPQDALPIAERAVVAPSSPDVQDTLGTVLLMTGKPRRRSRTSSVPCSVRPTRVRP